MRLIDADALKKQYYPFPCAIGVENAVTIRAINEAPTIDAVPVVCGECKYAVWEKSEIKYCETWGTKCDCPYEIALTATDYCSYGERLEDKPCR